MPKLATSFHPQKLVVRFSWNEKSWNWKRFDHFRHSRYPSSRSHSRNRKSTSVKTSSSLTMHKLYRKSRMPWASSEPKTRILEELPLEGNLSIGVVRCIAWNLQIYSGWQQLWVWSRSSLATWASEPNEFRHRLANPLRPVDCSPTLPTEPLYDLRVGNTSRQILEPEPYFWRGGSPKIGESVSKRIVEISYRTCRRSFFFRSRYCCHLSLRLSHRKSGPKILLDWAIDGVYNCHRLFHRSSWLFKYCFAIPLLRSTFKVVMMVVQNIKNPWTSNPVQMKLRTVRRIRFVLLHVLWSSRLKPIGKTTRKSNPAEFELYVNWRDWDDRAKSDVF